jgi:hypothetical protein
MAPLTGRCATRRIAGEKQRLAFPGGGAAAAAGTGGVCAEKYVARSRMSASLRLATNGFIGDAE